jgi:hypothetical protein
MPVSRKPLPDLDTALEIEAQGFGQLPVGFGLE